MIQQARAKGPSFVVDGGNLYWRSATIPPRELPQQQAKATLQAEAYAQAGVDAMLPGPGDLAMGLGFVTDLAARLQLPYVASDLVCDGKAPFPAVRMVERGGVRMAVVGLVGPVVAAGCTRTEPATALRAALDGADADVVLLLDGDDEPAATQVAATVGGIDFIMVADGKTTPTVTLLPSGGVRMGAGSRGKRVGALTFTLVPGGTGWRDDAAIDKLAADRDRYQERLDRMKAERERLDGPAAATADPKQRDRLDRQLKFYEGRVEEASAQLHAATERTGPGNTLTHTLIDLGADVADDPATAALVASAKADIDAAAARATADTPVAFAGSESCATCHVRETRQWRSTAHAQAWKALVDDHREHDAACFQCHVTGALLPGGPSSAVVAESAGLVDVGCEACHGPGRAHEEHPKQARMVAAPELATCTGCHDGEQDGGRFDYAAYLPRVVHTP